MRAALYWAPSAVDPLWALGCAWLGRDARSGARCAQPRIGGIAALTAAPRTYGFHATLRPPMHLRGPLQDVRDAAAEIAAGLQPFTLPPLKLANVQGFLALRESVPCPALRALADRCVILTEPHRQPASMQELRRRREAGLTPRQEALLQRWGYPYVMEEWFFHLTLTRRLSAAEASALHDAATAHFGAVLDVPRIVDEICIFTQESSDFMMLDRLPLGSGNLRVTT